MNSTFQVFRGTVALPGQPPQDVIVLRFTAKSGEVEGEFALPLQAVADLISMITDRMMEIQAARLAAAKAPKPADA